MKLKDVARFKFNNTKSLTPSQMRLAKARMGLNKPKLVQAINDHPGSTLRYLSKEAGYVQENGAYNTLRTLLKEGHVKKFFQDGKTRYYPGSYKTPAVVVKDKALPASPPPAPTADATMKQVFPPLASAGADIEALAKDYFWQTQSNNLREFVRWYKEQK